MKIQYFCKRCGGLFNYSKKVNSRGRPKELCPDCKKENSKIAQKKFYIKHKVNLKGLLKRVYVLMEYVETLVNQNKI